ncbi:unnamed protein product, partial [Amoebophrya sp. A25]
ELQRDSEAIKAASREELVNRALSLETTHAEMMERAVAKNKEDVEKMRGEMELREQRWKDELDVEQKRHEASLQREREMAESFLEKEKALFAKRLSAEIDNAKTETSREMGLKLRGN